nr:hypothetical protein [Tanacetum cinerariifolium]
MAPPFSAQSVDKAFVDKYYQILRGIKAKIQSHSYGDYRFEIKSVDAQESLEVAPMDNGYFVRNDMFRYIENTINHHGQDHAPNTQVTENVAVLENYFPEQADVKQEKSPAVNIFEFCDVPSDWEELPGGDAALIDATGKEVTYDKKEGAQSTNAKNFKERFNLFMQTP